LGFASFLSFKIHENFVNVPFYDEWIYMNKHISNQGVEDTFAIRVGA